MPNDIFGGDIARHYDETSSHMFTPEAIDPVVDVLAELAGSGRALEFASGTGRIALPLARRGVDVHGIKLSTAMVDEMMRKPEADRVPVVVGDMATAQVDGTFSLVFLVFNTITNLLTQAEQVSCFANAAAHLDPGGHFVIETGVPKLQRLQPGERFIPFDVSDEHIGFDEYDVVNQRSTSHHQWVRDGVATRFSSDHRWAYPAEYDLMAQLADMHLVERWSDWAGSEFTGTSGSHVSIWRKGATQVD